MSLGGDSEIPLPRESEDFEQGSSAATSLPAVSSNTAVCAHCSAVLVADQRYCLSCGQPASPVRLAFLDVLNAERDGELAPVAMAAAASRRDYAEPSAGPAWLRRYTPLFGVAAVLLLAMLIGLLLGHWVSQTKTPSAQVLKVEGLSASAPAAAAGATPATPAATSSASSRSSAASKKEEQNEIAEARAEEKKAPAPPKPVKVSASTLAKLTHSTGRKHQQELNNIGTAPIAVP